MSSAYHHQTIGKVERFHKFMENLLSTVVSKDQKNWANLVDSCLFVYRTTFNCGLNVLFDVGMVNTSCTLRTCWYQARELLEKL